MLDPFLSALLRGSWLIDESFAVSSLPIAIGVMNGSRTGTELLSGSGDFELPFFMAPDGQRREAFSYIRGQMIFTPEAALPESIAVVPFIGPMIKYNGSCGEPGMIKRQQWIGLMTSPENVIGYMSIIDTPGGQADGTPQTTDFIKAISKPTAALVMGQACSAGAWIASGHDEIYAADEFAEFGSIGAYQTVVDPRGKYEKEGYKIQSVYPKISKDKNLSYRKAIDGDTSMVEEEVGGLAQSFVDGFQANRSQYLKSDEWQTGKVFPAKKAVDMGLITGIKSMDEVFDSLRSRAKASKNQQSFNSSSMKTTNIEALSGKENLSDEDLALANSDLTVAGVTNVTLVTEAMITEAASATEQLASTKVALTTAEQNLSAANAKILDLETKFADLGKGPGATHTTNPTTTEEQVSATDKEDSNQVIAGLSHNKAAEEFLNNY